MERIEGTGVPFRVNFRSKNTMSADFVRGFKKVNMAVGKYQ